jgi:hypothetical protein
MHTEVLEPILPPSSKLILNNIKNDKVWTPQWPWP